mmetsp:Transcript_11550/g.36932  ORF Transcript_11550/g.36932 Transcript_11550/m.36932 type:complete len:388 (+) Transcript_11550:121-1284(+)
MPLGPSTSGILTWRTWKCVACLFWKGNPFFVVHYKGSKADFVAHYVRTWNMTAGHKRDAYFGASPLDDPARFRMNECPNNIAARYVRHQSLAMSFPWERRGGAPSSQVCLPEEFARPPLCRPHFAAIEVVLRREPMRNVKEWVEHHLVVGFGHIYMSVDDADAEVARYRSELQPYIDRGALSLFGTFGGQTGGHQFFSKTFMNGSFWMARVDIDEFVFPEPPEDSIVPLLRVLTGRRGRVPLQIMMGRAEFGDSGWVETPPEGITMTEAYRRSMALPKSVKAVWQTDGFLEEDMEFSIGNPHFGLTPGEGIRSGVTCQDYHWIFSWAIVCFPQRKFIFWWPPRLPASIELPMRPPIAQSVWDQAQRLAQLYQGDDVGLPPMAGTAGV